MRIKRQKVSERVGSFDLNQLTGHFEDIVRKIEELRHYYEESFPDALEIWVSDNNSYEYGGEFDVMIRRLENDKEYNARLKKLEREKALKEQRERAEYETYLRLKEKFGEDTGKPK